MERGQRPPASIPGPCEPFGFEANSRHSPHSCCPPPTSAETDVIYIVRSVEEKESKVKFKGAIEGTLSLLVHSSENPSESVPFIRHYFWEGRGHLRTKDAT